MDITLFRLEQGRLIYGDDNFVYFEPQPRFMINRNQKRLLLDTNNDDEISISLESVMSLLGFSSMEDCICFFYDNYFLQKIENTMPEGERTMKLVTSEDEEMVRLALMDFRGKVES
jgi:hypothetical protein